MKQVASLRYEVIFKKAFTEIDIFTAFVKDFTGVQLNIDKVETEKVFAPPIGSVASKFDLFAEDKTNRTIVDIQHVRFDDHYDRFLHYHCAAILQQISNSDSYKPNLKVFTIVVLTSGDRHKTDVGVIDFNPKDLQGNPFNEIEHKIIYLCPKYVNENTPEPYREWLRAIDDTLDGEVDETAYERAEIQRIFALIERNQVSPEENARMKDEYGYEQIGKDHFTKGVEVGMEKGMEKGIEVGIEKGVKRGELLANYKTAKTMLEKGFDLAVALEVTGLTQQQFNEFEEASQ
jgi:predicted transposase/invertase (TIGR01784 family)